MDFILRLPVSDGLPFEVDMFSDRKTLVVTTVNYDKALTPRLRPGCVILGVGELALPPGPEARETFAELLTAGVQEAPEEGGQVWNILIRDGPPVYRHHDALKLGRSNQPDVVHVATWYPMVVKRNPRKVNNPLMPGESLFTYGEDEEFEDLHSTASRPLEFLNNSRYKPVTELDV
jgi:hypothetical protein